MEHKACNMREIIQKRRVNVIGDGEFLKLSKLQRHGGSDLDVNILLVDKERLLWLSPWPLCWPWHPLASLQLPEFLFIIWFWTIPDWCGKSDEVLSKSLDDQRHFWYLRRQRPYFHFWLDQQFKYHRNVIKLIRISFTYLEFMLNKWSSCVQFDRGHYIFLNTEMVTVDEKDGGCIAVWEDMCQW